MWHQYIQTCNYQSSKRRDRNYITVQANQQHKVNLAKVMSSSVRDDMHIRQTKHTTGPEDRTTKGRTRIHTDAQ